MQKCLCEGKQQPFSLTLIKLLNTNAKSLATEVVKAVYVNLITQIVSNSQLVFRKYFARSNINTAPDMQLSLLYDQFKQQKLFW